jgi:hypothetical protein
MAVHYDRSKYYHSPGKYIDSRLGHWASKVSGAVAEQDMMEQFIPHEGYRFSLFLVFHNQMPENTPMVLRHHQALHTRHIPIDAHHGELSAR